MIMRSISPSSINIMLECPLCFWLQIVKGIRRPSGPFPSLPSGMDRVLKEHFDSFIQKGVLPPELANEPLALGCTLFDDLDKLNEWRDCRRGLQVVDQDTGILLRGAIDNLLRRKELAIILDYKTRGYPVKYDTQMHYQAQMHLYAYLLDQNGVKLEPDAFLLFYHPTSVEDKGAVIFATSLVPVPATPAEGESLFRRAAALLEQQQPAPAPDCPFCSYRSAGSTPPTAL